MFCNKCGNEVQPNQAFCNKCGNRLVYKKDRTLNDYNNYYINKNINMNINEKANQNTNVEVNNTAKKATNEKTTSSKSSSVAIPVLATILVIVLILWGFSYLIIRTSNGKAFYFSPVATRGDDDENTTGTPDPGPNQPSNPPTTNKYKTAIITDNVYTGISVNSVADAKALINEDSVNQKKDGYPQEIIDIENRIINNYSITAVNLKEMDVEFAKELEGVIKKIYEEYPGARGYLTNLTLTNLDMSLSKVIALFRPVFQFGTSNTDTTRPWVIKTQVQLNAKYFLNPERIDAAVDASSKAGHFPPNATKYSPVAHEFGHYLSFIALMNHYATDSILIIEDNKLQNFYDIYKDFGYGNFSKTMIEEAYQNYLRDTNENIGFDEWRGKISQYALAKDETGAYIYDETIAEAFHDVYLNGNNACVCSKYIVEVLKKYIGG